MSPGDVIAGYRLEELLGKGGMGAVWRAVQLETGGEYALKTVAPNASATVRERFLREGRLLAQVDHHPHIGRVHTAGEHAGQPYLVLELLRGGDLKQRLARGPLPPDEAVAVVRALAEGLSLVHAKGILHRDIKPANVLFDEDGTPKLVDFGVARVEASSLTASGALVGTPAYMSPEQVDGGAVDERSDVYALGALLFRCLTGATPFPRQSPINVLSAILRDPPPRPSSLAPGVPEALDALCLQALAKDPADRPPSAQAFADALAEPGEPTPRRGIVRLLAALVLLTGTATWALWPASEAPAPAPTAAPSAAPAAPEPPMTLAELRSLEDAGARVQRGLALLAEHPAHPEATGIRTLLTRVAGKGPVWRFDELGFPAVFVARPRDVPETVPGPFLLLRRHGPPDRVELRACGRAEPVRIWPLNGVSDMVSDPDGGEAKLLVAEGVRLSLHTIDPNEPEARRVLRWGDRRRRLYKAMGVAPDGTWFVASDQRLTVLTPRGDGYAESSLRPGTEANRLEIRDLAVGPRRLAVLLRHGLRVVVGTRRAAGWRWADIQLGLGMSKSAAFGPQGRFLYVGSEATPRGGRRVSYVWRIDLEATPPTVQMLNAEAKPSSLASHRFDVIGVGVSRAGQVVSVGGSVQGAGQAGSFKLWDADGVLRSAQSTRRPVYWLKLSPDRRFALTTGSAPHTQVWLLPP